MVTRSLLRVALVVGIAVYLSLAWMLQSCALGGAVGVSIDELEQRLRASDTNGDGFLSINEVANLIAALRAEKEGKAPPPTKVAASVTIDNRPASPIEINALIAAIRAVDANKDGRVSPQEKAVLVSKPPPQPASRR